MSNFIDEAANRLQKNTLVQITNMVNWKNLGKKIGNLDRSGYGPKPYDPIKMFKALILQAWHSLSDAALEEALKVRMDFMVITELTDVPDETTICRFRNLLIEKNLMDELLAEINNQLENKGFKIKESNGAILDATLITSAARPNKEIKTIAVDREENVYETTEEALSKDSDATWLKKGKKSYFGYKGFMVVDKDNGFITNIHMTSAHVSEVKELVNILPKLDIKPGARLYTDKGYASKNNRDLLKKYGIKDGIMEKAQRNKPLSPCQKLFNKMISKTRYKVEQGFGTLKRRFKFERASYFTTVKVHGQMILKAVAFNILKAINIFKFKPILQLHQI